MREHHPVWGRWLSPDPAGLDGVDPTDPQSWNRYGYVRNSPTNLVDPLGLDNHGAGPPCNQVSDPNCWQYFGGFNFDPNDPCAYINTGFDASCGGGAPGLIPGFPPTTIFGQILSGFPDDCNGDPTGCGGGGVPIWVWAAVISAGAAGACPAGWICTTSSTSTLQPPPARQGFNWGAFGNCVEQGTFHADIKSALTTAGYPRLATFAAQTLTTGAFINTALNAPWAWGRTPGAGFGMPAHETSWQNYLGWALRKRTGVRAFSSVGKYFGRAFVGLTVFEGGYDLADIVTCALQ